MKINENYRSLSNLNKQTKIKKTESFMINKSEDENKLYTLNKKPD